jgi:serine/threonine protein kinase
VQLFEIIDDDKFDKLYLIMEYVNGGTLLSKIKKATLSEDECRQCFRGIASALTYCHEKAGVVHRDIKPENIMLDSQGNVKITDFGVSFIMDSSMNDETHYVVGSHSFFAPEICREAKFKAKPSDVWASGVTLYYMLCGKLPFVGNNIGELYQAITEKEPDYSEFNSETSSLIKKMLDKDPQNRITMKMAMEDGWLTQYGTNPIDYQNVSIIINENEAKEAFSEVKVMRQVTLRRRMHNRLTEVQKKLAQNQNNKLLNLNKCSDM